MSFGTGLIEAGKTISRGGHKYADRQADQAERIAASERRKQDRSDTERRWAANKKQQEDHFTKNYNAKLDKEKREAAYRANKIKPLDRNIPYGKLGERALMEFDRDSYDLHQRATQGEMDLFAEREIIKNNYYKKGIKISDTDLDAELTEILTAEGVRLQGFLEKFPGSEEVIKRLEKVNRWKENPTWEAYGQYESGMPSSRSYGGLQETSFADKQKAIAKRQMDVAKERNKGKKQPMSDEQIIDSAYSHLESLKRYKDNPRAQASILKTIDDEVLKRVIQIGSANVIAPEAVEMMGMGKPPSDRAGGKSVDEYTSQADQVLGDDASSLGLSPEQIRKLDEELGL